MFCITTLVSLLRGFSVLLAVMAQVTNGQCMDIEGNRSEQIRKQRCTEVRLPWVWNITEQIS